MAASRSEHQLAEIGAFINELYKLGGYATWKEFADEAKITPPQLSDFQSGKVEPAGLNLLRLVQAAARRVTGDAAEVALRTAQEASGALLEHIQGDVSELLLGQADVIARLAALQQRERPAQTRPVPKAKAAGRKTR